MLNCWIIWRSLKSSFFLKLSVTLTGPPSSIRWHSVVVLASAICFGMYSLTPSKVWKWEFWYQKFQTPRLVLNKHIFEPFYSTYFSWAYDGLQLLEDTELFIPHVDYRIETNFILIRANVWLRIQPQIIWHYIEAFAGFSSENDRRFRSNIQLFHCLSGRSRSRGRDRGSRRNRGRRG